VEKFCCKLVHRNYLFKECIRALGSNGSHVPFRGSKLTQVNCLCVCISHIIQLTPQQQSAEPRNSDGAEFFFFLTFLSYKSHHICRAQSATFRCKLVHSNSFILRGASALWDLAFTRYCHSQYCKIYIAIQGGRGETIYCATEWTIEGVG